MFKCEVCGTSAKRHERPVRVVTETREKEYPARDYQVRGGREVRDPGGFGIEIVREVLAHQKCAVIYERMAS